MNLIPKIAEMLGVEIGEEFKISQDGEVLYDGTLYKFNDSWFFRHNNDDDNWDLCANPTLLLLLNGQNEIFKLPFEPKKGEKYFVVSVVDKTVMPFIWDGTTTDYCFKACGNCFRTEAEAEAHKYEIYERLTGKKWEE